MNSRGANVRKPRADAGRGDPRADRSKRALGAALIELMLERAYDEITVQDVLDRAEVGRATFYSHFRNKKDLFLSDYERMLEGMAAHLARDPRAVARVAPVAEFLGHVAEARPLLAALQASGQFELVWQLGAAHFARMIEKRLKLLVPSMPPGASYVLVSRFCAGALIEMLKWWLDRDVRPSPAQMDEMYHQMVWKAVR